MSENNKENVSECEDSSVFETGSITVEKNGHFIHCLTIIGQIEGHFILPSQNKTTKYEHVIPQLVAIEESKEIEGLLIILNTVGGDVEAGLAIAELLSTMKTPTASLVLGGGHSIGVPLAVSCQRSFIVPSATMTVHPVRMNGTLLGVPQTLSYFEKMQDRITGFVTANSKIKPERFTELMMERDELVLDIGTVLDGKSAVREGLIDKLGSLSDAVNCLYELIEKRKSTTSRKNVRKTAPKAVRVSKKTETKRAASEKRTEKTMPKSETAQSRIDEIRLGDWRGER